MSLTVNAKSYVADAFSGPNLTVYAGPAQTLSIKDRIALGRTAAKPTSEFSGVVRASAKLTRTLTLTGALTSSGDAIFEMKTSIPVGAAGADIDTACADLGAWIASAEFKTALKESQVNI